MERAGPHSTTDGRAQTSPDWQVQYAFDLAHVAPGDLEQANHWTATRPATRFTTLHIATCVLPDGFASLIDKELKISREGGGESGMLDTPEQWREVLADVFGIELSPEEIAQLPLFESQPAR